MTDHPTQFLPKLGFLFLYSLLSVSPVRAARIVSLLPSNTEILDALGAGGDIVGITRFDRSVTGRTVVGDFFQPNLETIVSLKPDLIVSGVWSSSRIGRHLHDLGYPTLEIPNPQSLEELYGSIRQIARSVHRGDQADRIIQDMKARLASLSERSRRLPRRLRTYVEIDPPFWTIGGHDFLNEALAAAGVDNIFADLARPSSQVSPEVIVERDPELILSFDLSKAEIGRRTGWGGITAVRKGWVLDALDRDELSRPSPRLLDGIEALESRVERLIKNEAHP